MAPSMAPREIFKCAPSVPASNPLTRPDAPVEAHAQAHATPCGRPLSVDQGMIHNTRVAGSSVGTARDVQVVQELYQEDWWLAMLAARNKSAIWERCNDFDIISPAFLRSLPPTPLPSRRTVWSVLRGSMFRADSHAFGPRRDQIGASGSLPTTVRVSTPPFPGTRISTRRWW